MIFDITSHWWDGGKVLQKQPFVERLRAFHAINRSFRFRERIDEWLSGGVVRPSHFRNHLQKLLAQDGEMADLSVSRPSSRQHWGIPVPGDSTQVQTSSPQKGFPLTDRLREVRIKGGKGSKILYVLRGRHLSPGSLMKLDKTCAKQSMY